MQAYTLYFFIFIFFKFHKESYKYVILFSFRGIEWIGLTAFISYSHPNMVNSFGHVKNELVLTDLQSGRTKSLRADRSEESPIDMIRVSYLRYFI